MSQSVSSPKNIVSSALSLGPSFGNSVVAVGVPVAAGEAGVAVAVACYFCTVAATVTNINSAICFICAASNMFKIYSVFGIYFLTNR